MTKYAGQVAQNLKEISKRIDSIISESKDSGTEIDTKFLETNRIYLYVSDKIKNTMKNTSYRIKEILPHGSYQKREKVLGFQIPIKLSDDASVTWFLESVKSNTVRKIWITANLRKDDVDWIFQREDSNTGRIDVNLRRSERPKWTYLDIIDGEVLNENFLKRLGDWVNQSQLEYIRKKYPVGSITVQAHVKNPEKVKIISHNVHAPEGEEAYRTKPGEGTHTEVEFIDHDVTHYYNTLALQGELVPPKLT